MKKLFTLLVFTLPLNTQASVFSIKCDKVNNTDVSEAAIYFNASVSGQTVT